MIGRCIEYYNDNQQSFALVEDSKGDIFYRCRCSGGDKLLFTVDKPFEQFDNLYEFIRSIDENEPFDSVPIDGYHPIDIDYEIMMEKIDMKDELGWKHPIRTLHSWMDNGFEEGDEIVNMFGAEFSWTKPTPLNRMVDYVRYLILFWILTSLIGMIIFGLISLIS